MGIARGGALRQTVQQQTVMFFSDADWKTGPALKNILVICGSSHVQGSASIDSRFTVPGSLLLQVGARQSVVNMHGVLQGVPYDSLCFLFA